MIFNVGNRAKYGSGIYIIRSTVTNDFYIGRSNCFFRRYLQHLSACKSKKNIATKRLNDYVAKYGFETLIFERYKSMPSNWYLVEAEKKAIHKMKPTLNSPINKKRKYCTIKQAEKK